MRVSAVRRDAYGSHVYVRVPRQTSELHVASAHREGVRWLVSAAPNIDWIDLEGRFPSEEEAIRHVVVQITARQLRLGRSEQ